MVCIDRDGAASLVLYLEALHRWLRDLDTLCRR